MRLRPWPDTLLGRTLLVLAAGLVCSQLAAMAIYSANRLEILSRVGGEQTADRIIAAVRLVEATPSAGRVDLLHKIDMPTLRVGWGERPVVAAETPEGGGDAAAPALDDALAARLADHQFRAALFTPPTPPPANQPDPGAGMFRVARDGVPVPASLRVAVRLSDGTWLNFVSAQRPPDPSSRMRFYIPLLAGALVVLLLSAIAVRYATRPLAQLAAAAERLGRDVASPPMAERGPREVRAAAHAFNEMQTRLRRFVEDRTQMVAAISHDLRTPITRLKLRAEFVEDDDQRARMLSDLDEMETMIASTLAFAREDAARETRRKFDLAALLAELAGDFGATYFGPDRLEFRAGPTAIKRAFANLIENAEKYGGSVSVTLAATATGAAVVIEDGGPGIPEAELERVFQPFYRVESSRNRETGGTGLGLSVARSVIRAHGGDIVLANRAEGGLRVTVTLPNGM